jgi:hypothetical protein
MDGFKIANKTSTADRVSRPANSKPLSSSRQGLEKSGSDANLRASNQVFNFKQDHYITLFEPTTSNEGGSLEDPAELGQDLINQKPRDYTFYKKKGEETATSNKT